MAVAAGLGATVYDTSGVGGDFPDLVIGIFGRTVLVEIKNPAGRNRESSGQRLARLLWKGGEWWIVRDEAELIERIQQLAKAGR